MGEESDDDDVVQRYVDALAVFGNAVRSIADHEWDLPTPCPEWNTKELVAHVVLGEAHLPAVLAGEVSTTQVSITSDILGPDPLAAWRGTALRAIEAAKVQGMVDDTFESDLGPVTGRQLLGYRITDNIVHAWDLAVAVGRPARIEPDHADWLLEFWQPVALQLAESAFFGAAVEPLSDQPGDRLLALLGRTAPAA